MTRALTLGSTLNNAPLLSSGRGVCNVEEFDTMSVKLVEFVKFGEFDVLFVEGEFVEVDVFEPGICEEFDDELEFDPGVCEL